VIRGIKCQVSLCSISTMKVRKCLRKGCRIYAIDIVDENYSPSIELHVILFELKDVFPLEFSGILYVKEIDFIVTLKPRGEPTSKTPY